MLTKLFSPTINFHTIAQLYGEWRIGELNIKGEKTIVKEVILDDYR